MQFLQYIVNFELSGNGVDYDSSPVEAIFPSGATSTMINIILINDTIAEGPETFDLDLTIPLSLNGQVVLGANANAIGNITDDTSKITDYNSTLSTHVLF